MGGYDGSNRVSTIEIFDPRANSWRIGSPFSIARGYGCAVTMDDNLFYIGGVNDAGETVNTVSLSGVTVPLFIFIELGNYLGGIILLELAKGPTSLLLLFRRWKFTMRGKAGQCRVANL